MPKYRKIRVRGKQREDMEVDLLAQIVAMMARQLAQEAAEDEAAAPEGLEVETNTDEDGVV